MNKNNSQTELTHHVKLIANAKIAIKWFCYNCISMEWWYNTIKVIYIMIHWVIFLVCIKSLLSNQAPNILSVEVEEGIGTKSFWPMRTQDLWLVTNRRPRNWIDAHHMMMGLIANWNSKPGRKFILLQKSNDSIEDR